MSRKSFVGCVAALVLLAGGRVGPASAQTAAPAEAAAPNPLAVTDGAAMPAAREAPAADPGVIQAGCATCGGGLLGPAGGGDLGPGGTHGPGGCGASCYPGRLNDCAGCCADSCLGRAFCSLYECVCCPDPCYEPRWLPVADSAFFVDAARPVTQMRLRWDSDFSIRQADRAEYLFARYRTTPNQLGPGGPCAPPNLPGKGFAFIPRNVDVDSLSLYSEVAAGAFGLGIEVPYDHIDPNTSGISSAPACPSSGFADLNIATKAMLLDCELVQTTFEFKTFVPTGSPGKGLGTGHVSLEPSLLFSLRLSPEMYLQGQLAYWVPIGGDPLYEGNIFHAHVSLNHVLWSPWAAVQLVGTLELNEWSILGGAYTGTDFLLADPAHPGAVAPFAASGVGTVVSAGPGIRAFICEKIDVGVGSAFSLTGDRWAEEVIRAELRWRF